MEIIEFGCGAGTTARDLAEHNPKLTIFGLDLSEEAVQIATKRASERGVNNVKFAVQDICNLPSEWTDKWEFIYMIDVAHDVPQTTKLIKELHRVLKPGGYAFILDINLHTNVAENREYPAASMLYSISLFHCMPVSLYAEGGEGLGNAWGKEKAIQMLREGGFKKVEILEENFDIHYIVTK